MWDRLERYRSVWERKPVLRVVYDDFFRRISAACVPGITIELGGGTGNLKEKFPNVISSDIQFAPWLDLVADAQHLPFADATLSNIVMVDVLHHIEYPLVFFREAHRALRLGGRIVMVEPAITPGSFLFYRCLHEEPVRLSADPLTIGVPKPNRDPYDSNQAIPTLIATRDRSRFHSVMPGLRIADVQWFSFIIYPLSGGFQSWSLLSHGFAKAGLRLERLIEPVLGRVAGFRMLLAIEKCQTIM
jgi:SAM-dependent methyltransferase